MKKILVIEDNADTRRFLEAMLGRDYQVISAENAVIGIDYARNQNPDLILLDIMMPILSGYDACSLLKKDDRTKRIPIIFLSAKNQVNDITQGLSHGADDYIPKPFDYKELIARIEARLRQKQNEPSAAPISIGELTIEPTSRNVTYGDKRISLTLTEFDILKCLATRAGHVVSRDEIMTQVWKEDQRKATDRTIDVHVRALRKKIPQLTRHILSIYGVGYKYEK